MGVIVVLLTLHHLDPPYVTANIEILPFASLHVERVLWDNSLLLTWLELQDHGVHSVDWAWLAASGKQFLTADRTGHNIAN